VHMHVAQGIDALVGAEPFNVTEVLGPRGDESVTVLAMVVVPGSVRFEAPARDIVGDLGDMAHEALQVSKISSEHSMCVSSKMVNLLTNFDKSIYCQDL
jgi:hypothetical protein